MPARSFKKPLGLGLKSTAGGGVGCPRYLFKFPVNGVVCRDYKQVLLPGDVISTGTPFGVGLGLTPPRYLKDGDVVELGIEGLGTSKQTFVDYKE